MTSLIRNVIGRAHYPALMALAWVLALPGCYKPADKPEKAQKWLVEDLKSENAYDKLHFRKEKLIEDHAKADPVKKIEIEAKLRQISMAQAELAFKESIEESGLSDEHQKIKMLKEGLKDLEKALKGSDGKPVTSSEAVGKALEEWMELDTVHASVRPDLLDTDTLIRFLRLGEKKQVLQVRLRIAQIKASIETARLEADELISGIRARSIESLLDQAEAEKLQAAVKEGKAGVLTTALYRISVLRKQVASHPAIPYAGKAERSEIETAMFQLTNLEQTISTLRKALFSRYVLRELSIVRREFKAKSDSRPALERLYLRLVSIAEPPEGLVFGTGRELHGLLDKIHTKIKEKKGTTKKQLERLYGNALDQGKLVTINAF